MNSTLQALWALPELAARYLPDPARSFEAAPRDVPGDVLTQVRGRLAQLGGDRVRAISGSQQMWLSGCV